MEAEITLSSCCGTPKAEDTQPVCRDRGCNITQHQAAEDMAA